MVSYSSWSKRNYFSIYLSLSGNPLRWCPLRNQSVQSGRRVKVKEGAKSSATSFRFVRSDLCSERSHHRLRCRLKPDPNLQEGKYTRTLLSFDFEGNRGLLILQPVPQLGHKHMCIAQMNTIIESEVSYGCLSDVALLQQCAFLFASQCMCSFIIVFELHKGCNTFIYSQTDGKSSAISH